MTKIPRYYYFFHTSVQQNTLTGMTGRQRQTLITYKNAVGVHVQTFFDIYLKKKHY